MRVLWLLGCFLGLISLDHDAICGEDDSLAKHCRHDVVYGRQLEVELVDLQNDAFHLDELIEGKRAAHERADVLHDWVLDLGVFRGHEQRNTCDKSADLLANHVVATFVSSSEAVNHGIDLQEVVVNGHCHVDGRSFESEPLGDLEELLDVLFSISEVLGLRVVFPGDGGVATFADGSRLRLE